MAMRKKSKEFLFSYLNAYSPTGFEWTGQQLWIDYIKPYVDEIITDTYGTAVAVINPGKEYSVAIEAHADEIAWYVNYIDDKGYIYIKRNGGSDHQIAPSKRVVIHTQKGLVPAVFGWPAIHVRDRSKELAPSLKNLFLDCGCESKDEVENLGIHVGCVVTFTDELMEMNDKYFVGRALDNRMGGFMIAEVARQLKEKKKNLDYTLYVVNAVQEEIGLRGAEMISRRLKPDVAIVTDVCHDTRSPMYDKKVQGDIKAGHGPVLIYSPSVHNELLNSIVELAEKKKISFQRLAVSRSTGTDTDAFAYSDKGIASMLISLPLKYMHTTVETVHKADVDNVIKLIYESLLKLKKGQDFSYFG